MDLVIKTLQKDLDRALAGDDKLEIIQTHTALGQAYLDRKETTKAYTQFDLALKIARDLDHKPSLSRLLGLTGICQKELGNYDMSLETLNEALAIAKEVGDPHLEGDAQFNIGALLADMGKPLKAISYLDNALAATLTGKDRIRKLAVSNLLGNIFLGMESIDKAVENYATALETAKTLNNHEAEAASRVHLGQTFLMDEAYDGALENFELALQIADRENLFLIELQALYGLTQACSGTGNTSLAGVYGEQLVNKTRSANLPARELSALQVLAGVYTQAENYLKSIPILERAIELSREAGDTTWELNSLVDLGTAHYMEGHLTQAENYLREALAIAEHLHQGQERAVISSRLASLLADSGDYDQSNQLIQTTLQIVEELDLPILKGEQLVLQALNYKDQDKPQKAKQYLENAIQLYRENDRDDLAENAKELLSELE